MSEHDEVGLVYLLDKQDLDVACFVDVDQPHELLLYDFDELAHIADAQELLAADHHVEDNVDVLGFRDLISFGSLSIHLLQLQFAHLRPLVDLEQVLYQHLAFLDVDVELLDVLLSIADAMLDGRILRKRGLALSHDRPLLIERKLGPDLVGVFREMKRISLPRLAELMADLLHLGAALYCLPAEIVSNLIFRLLLKRLLVLYLLHGFSLEHLLLRLQAFDLLFE